LILQKPFAYSCLAVLKINSNDLLTTYTCTFNTPMRVNYVIDPQNIVKQVVKQVRFVDTSWSSNDVKLQIIDFPDKT